MKRVRTLFFGILIVLLATIIAQPIFAQVAVNTTGAVANSKSILDITSSDKGLLIPRMTTAQRNTFASGIGTTEKGMMVFDTDEAKFYYWNGTSFVALNSGYSDKLVDSNGDSEIRLSTYTGGDLVDIQLGNADYFKFKPGRLEFVNTGSSVFIGENAGMDDDKNDNQNVFIGSLSGRFNTTGFYNVATGYSSLRDNLTGIRNVAIGYYAMLGNMSGSSNTAVGENCLKNLDSSNNNTAIGSNSLILLQKGSSNTAMGSGSLYTMVTGESNTVIGDYAGFNVDTGRYNVMIGYRSGYANSPRYSSGNVFLGYMSGYNETGSNKLYIENSSSSSPLIGGDFSADEVYINGTLKITGGNPKTGKFLLSDNSGNAIWDSISLNQINNVIETDTSVFIGYSAGVSDDGNNYNVGVGREALHSNQTGVKNVAVGNLALYSGVSGSFNTAIGNKALYSNTGGENTAVGYYSLANNTGSFNVALGLRALNNNTGGFYNVGVGNYSNYYNQNGSYNTTIGYSAGFGSALHSSSGNVFIGYNAGYYEMGNNKLYIENSDSNTPLIGGDFAADEVYINGTLKISGGSPGNGKILTSDASGNASWQENAAATELNELTDASFDGSSLFVGDSAGFSDNGTNNDNTALGKNALYSNVAGGSNTAIGNNSLENSVNTFNNTAVGYRTMNYNVSGSGNTAVGTQAMLFNNSADNTGIGFLALRGNTSGQKNTAIGSSAMINSGTGYENVAAGYESMGSNSSGYYNTALGNRALYSNSTGHQNIAVGHEAGLNGDHTQCTFVGASADNNGGTARTNSTAIGYGAIIYGSNMVRLGNASVVSIGGYADWTNISDKRFKSKIKEDVPGLDFILKLRPVTYQLDLQAINKHLGMNNTPKNINKAKQKAIQTGFIAQEVEKTANDIGYEFSGVDKPEDEGGQYGLRYAQFVVPLVKGMQEQQQQIQRLEAENADLKIRLEKLEKIVGER